MKNKNPSFFYKSFHNKKEPYPFQGQIELTYRCNLNCVHCYCKGSEDKERELSTLEWKKIIDEIHKEGCLWLAVTGGEPLVREDFLEVYSYAKSNGFIVTLFTNGQGFTDKIIDYLAKSPPHSIEITLNGLSRNTYESITQVAGSHDKVIHAIKRLDKEKLPLIIKTNCLKQNKHEIAEIKKWTENFLGKNAENNVTCDLRPATCDIKKYNFKYDPMIYPRLNGDKTPTDYRLSFEEMLEIKKQDPDMWKQHEKCLEGASADFQRDRSFLYRCTAWTRQFFINPYGKLKFCQFSEKFSADLRKTSFKEGFYHRFPQLLNEEFKTDSECKDCLFRAMCYHCPARAYLETGDEEAPVPYYCELAKATAQQMKLLNC